MANPGPIATVVQVGRVIAVLPCNWLQNAAELFGTKHFVPRSITLLGDRSSVRINLGRISLGIQPLAELRIGEVLKQFRFVMNAVFAQTRLRDQVLFPQAM